LDKARELLDQADTVMGVGLNEAAGRTAYLVALHAAQALIFENTSKIVTSRRKTSFVVCCACQATGPNIYPTDTWTETEAVERWNWRVSRKK
jgi:hypothetical protein